MTNKRPFMAWVLTDNLEYVLHATARLEPTRELRKLGWIVQLIASGAGGVHTVRGVEIETVVLPQIYLIRQFIYHFRVTKLLLKNWKQLDVIFCQQISLLWLLPLKLLRIMSGRKRPLLVMDTRDLNSADGNLKTKIRVAYYNFMHKIANRFADGQTVITRQMAQMIAVPKDKLLGIWPSGVTIEHFSPAIQHRRWPKDNQPIHLVYIGRLHHERHLFPLCDALIHANQTGMMFNLSLVGQGPDVDKLEQLASESNNHIHILPPVLHREIPDLLTKAHIGVTSLPPMDDQKFQASSPIKLFEYLASGLPVLSTPNQCHTDVTGTDRYVFWAENPNEADLYQALQAIWQCRQELPNLGKEAYTAAQNWSWQASALKLSTALLNGAGMNMTKQENLKYGIIDE